MDYLQELHRGITGLIQLNNGLRMNVTLAIDMIGYEGSLDRVTTIHIQQRYCNLKDLGSCCR